MAKEESPWFHFPLVTSSELPPLKHLFVDILEIRKYKLLDKLMASSIILVRCQLLFAFHKIKEKPLSPNFVVQVNMHDKVSRAFFTIQLADHSYVLCKLQNWSISTECGIRTTSSGMTSHMMPWKNTMKMAIFASLVLPVFTYISLQLTDHTLVFYGKKEAVTSELIHSLKYNNDPSSCKCYNREEAVPDVEIASELAICVLTLVWSQSSRQQPWAVGDKSTGHDAQ